MFNGMFKNIRLSFLGDRHRRKKLFVPGFYSFVKSKFFSGIYLLGLRAERVRKHLFRNLRHAFSKVSAGVKTAAKDSVTIASSSANVAAKDIVSPFKKISDSVKSFRALMNDMKGASRNAKIYRMRVFLRNGWRKNRDLVGRFASYALPVAALAICIFTINSVVSKNYAVAVSYNGVALGCVEDEGVYDSAVKIIDDKFIDASDGSWKSPVKLTISVADEENLLDADQMANNILSASGTEIVEATGLYVGGQFMGATTAGEMLQEKLNSILAPYKAQAASMGSGVNVRFSRKVETIDGVYPSEDIVSYISLCNKIDDDSTKSIYYPAVAGQTLDYIAGVNNITVSRLKELNEGLELEDTLAEDVSLLVAKDESEFCVKIVGTITKKTVVPYTSTIRKDPAYNLGYYQIIVQGVDGEQTTITEVEYQDGKEISRTVISEEITLAPVEQMLVVGVGGASSSGEGTGILGWPTAPKYQYISARFGWRTLRGAPNYHYGIDIACRYGHQIWAADNGVVIRTARLKDSYGTYCMVDHGNGIVTLYAHCSALLVEEGDVVAKGQTIALVGSTGNSTGNHLHFEVRVNGVKVDPFIYLD